MPAPKDRDPTQLNPKQQRFVQEYLVDTNATQAAIRAGYSPRTADVQGPRLLGNVRVAAALARAQAERGQRVRLTADDVLAELAVLSSSDALNHYVMTPEGHLDLAPGAPPEASRAVAIVKRKVRTFTDKDGNSTTTFEVEFRLWDKNSALEKAGKHLGLYTDRVHVSGDGTFRIVVEREGRNQ
jgi:phage terminase small subunit